MTDHKICLNGEMRLILDGEIKLIFPLLYLLPLLSGAPAYAISETEGI